MLSPKEASKLLTFYRKTKEGAFRRVSFGPKALANMRSLGKGPKYTKDEDGKVYYQLEDLRSFREEKKGGM